MRRTTLTRAIHLSALLVITVGGMFACSTEKVSKNPIALPGAVRPSVTVSAPPATPSDTPKTDNATAVDANLNIVGNGAEAPQRKNFEQLKQAFSSCLGSEMATSEAPDLDMLKLSSDMILLDPNEIPAQAVNPQLLAGGKKTRFLSKRYASDAAESKTVLELEREYLDSPVLRTSTAADSLEDEVFLKSLATLANVAAFNCDVESPTSRCYCATPDAAKTMLKRCLPQFSPESAVFKSLVEAMASPDNCGSQDSMVRRRAVASLLSSYAFAMAK